MYNAVNRAMSFTSQDGNMVVECCYDYQGCRYMKKVTVNETVTSHERYLYRGYLQVAALDVLNSRNVLRTLLWDPLEPIATRPLALVQDASLYCYGWDFNKNVTEVFDEEGSIAAAYDYSPYGQVASTGDIVQPVQWSSEMNDAELSLVYYNYRYYNPADGRWINRDPIAEEGGWNLYGFVKNDAISKNDGLGLVPNEQDPIFIFPYVDENTGYGQMTYASEEEIKKFYDTVNALSQKTVDDKKCYKLYVVKNRSAILKDAQNKKCDIKLIIGHGIKIDGKDFVRLKDGLICINDLNKDGKLCKGFGCCIGENKTTIPHTVAVQQLTAEVNRLLNSEDCPCKNVCILSGPINQ